MNGEKWILTTKSSESLARVAVRQRQLILLSPLLLVVETMRMMFIPPFTVVPDNAPAIAMLLVWIGARLLSTGLLWQMMTAMEKPVLFRVLLFGACWPIFIGLLLLWIVTHSASPYLRTEGVQVGPLGVGPKALARLMAGERYVRRETDPFAPED